nr:hypothetical protein [Pelomonas sp. P8]
MTTDDCPVERRSRQASTRPTKFRKLSAPGPSEWSGSARCQYASTHSLRCSTVVPAIEQGIHSYKHVKALTERLVADALAAIDATAGAEHGHDPGRADLAQEHALIRDSQEYGSLFAQAAAQAGAHADLGGEQP